MKNRCFFIHRIKFRKTKNLSQGNGKNNSRIHRLEIGNAFTHNCVGQNHTGLVSQADTGRYKQKPNLSANNEKPANQKIV